MQVQAFVFRTFTTLSPIQQQVIGGFNIDNFRNIIRTVRGLFIPLGFGLVYSVKLQTEAVTGTTDDPLLIGEHFVKNVVPQCNVLRFIFMLVH